MIVETATGRYTLTALSHDSTSDVTVTADDFESLCSLLDSVELLGGAHGVDRRFTSDDIHEFNHFGATKYRTRLTRGELIRFLEAEVLNYLDYTSLREMHGLQKKVTT